MDSEHRNPPDLTGARWRTSTYSGGNNERLEAADGNPHLAPLRDSKRPAGPVITFSPDAWHKFIGHLD